MIVDCMSCPVRGQRCDDCVVTVLLSTGPDVLPLDADESRVVWTLVGAGLVSAQVAGEVRARREPLESSEGWAPVRSVG